VAWECPCGVANREAKDACRGCGTPRGTVWTAQGFASPAEARLLAKLGGHRAPSTDHVGRLVRMVWMAAVVLGAWAGFSLAYIRSHKGPWAAKASLHAWKNLPRTVWGYVTTRLGPEAVIGLGIILLVVFFLSPRQVRASTFGLLGTVAFAVIVATGIGAVIYFVGVFVYDLGPYFGSR
jgi:hypothetical protein